jgi:hypothetical protein
VRIVGLTGECADFSECFFFYRRRDRDDRDRDRLKFSTKKSATLSTFQSKYTRALTFENFGTGVHPGMTTAIGVAEAVGGGTEGDMKWTGGEGMAGVGGGMGGDIRGSWTGMMTAGVIAAAIVAGVEAGLPQILKSLLYFDCIQ